MSHAHLEVLEHLRVLVSPFAPHTTYRLVR
jgi:hypothetical protein